MTKQNSGIRSTEKNTVSNAEKGYGDMSYPLPTDANKNATETVPDDVTEDEAADKLNVDGK